MEDVDAETSKTRFRDREVDFQFFRKKLELSLIHQFERCLLDHFWRHFEFVNRHDLAVDLDLGGRIRRKEKV